VAGVQPAMRWGASHSGRDNRGSCRLRRGAGPGAADTSDDVPTTVSPVRPLAHPGDALEPPQEAVDRFRTHNEDISPLEGRALHPKYRSGNASREPLEDLALIKDDAGWGSDPAAAGRQYVTGSVVVRASRIAAGRSSARRRGGASVAPFLQIRPNRSNEVTNGLAYPFRSLRHPITSEEK
jgi:hypothetical protein